MGSGETSDVRAPIIAARAGKGAFALGQVSGSSNMDFNNAPKAKALFLTIALGMAGAATAVRADELQELKSQIEALQKRVSEMERKELTQAAESTGAGYAKDLPPVADDGSLTVHGITLFGTVDIGVTYQTHGTPLSNSAGLGLQYLISKNSNHSQFSLAPNAMSSSSIGLKGTIEIVPGVSGIFKLETAFLPTSGRLADGLGSIVQNNGVPLASQTTNADSSRNGQAFNSTAWAGLSSPTVGALTFGRQNALTLDGVIAYDPM